MVVVSCYQICISGWMGNNFQYVGLVFCISSIVLIINSHGILVVSKSTQKKNRSISIFREVGGGEENPPNVFVEDREILTEGEFRCSAP